MLNGKPLICVSSDVKTMESDSRRRITELHQTYTNAVFQAGGIPMATCGVCADEMAELCDGLLLTGGADMDPELYGEEKLNDSVKPLPEAAAFHIWLLLAVGAASVTVPSLLAVSRLPEDTLVMV